MATGDMLFFEEALEFVLDGGWEAADDIKCALLDNTTPPTRAFATPALADFTEMETAGTYTAGGTSLGNWGAFNVEAAGVLTMDSATNPTWAQNASNGVDASWALIYHVATGFGICFLELGTVDMTAGDLTITWGGSGLVTITIT